MFIKQKQLERLLKEAYKENSLYISRTRSDTDEAIYTIAGNSWAIWVGEEWLTKEAKAAIIKLCDDLPEMGGAYRIQWGEKQMEMDDVFHNALLDYFKSEQELRQTRLMLTRNERILQCPEGKIYLARGKDLDLINEFAVDHENGEKSPVGPFLSKEKNRIYWRNNVCTVMIRLLERNEEEKELWEHLEGIKVI